MEFKVRHLPRDAAEVRVETLSAATDKALREHLEKLGSVVLSIERGALHQGRVLRRARASIDVAWWCNELETLLRAGMTVVEAIETLHAQEPDGFRGELHQRLLTRLRQGQALSEALHAEAAFPAVLVAGVAASERTSRLPEALAEYVGYHEVVQRLRRQATSAALYPAMVMAVGAVVSLFLLLYVIPRFSRMYGGMPQTVSGATEFVLGLSALLRDHEGALVAGLCAIAAAVAWGLRGQIGQRMVLWLLESFGPVARVWAHFRLAQLFRALALLVRGGYSLEEALRMTVGMRLGSRWETALDEVRRRILAGRPASLAFAEAGLTDTTTQRLLAAGERSGAFDRVLQVTADRHAQQFGLRLERATRIIEPALLLMVALFVGSLVVLMYMPIFDMAGGLGVSR